MIEYSKFLETLESQDITSEQKEEMLKLVKPLYDFDDYMKKKLNISSEEIDKLSEAYSKERMLECQDKILEMKVSEDSETSPIQETIKLTAKIFGDFAKLHEYDKCEELEKSLYTYLEIILIEQIRSMGFD